MINSSYYLAREKMVEIINKDLLGPVREDEIIENECPTEYYILGKLYPQVETSENGIIDVSSSEDCKELLDEDQTGISLSGNKTPSSFGLSFSMNIGKDMFSIQPQAAKYEYNEDVETDNEDVETDNEDVETDSEDVDEKEWKGRRWKRCVINFAPIDVNVSKLEVGKSIRVSTEEQGIEIRILKHKVYKDGSKTITVSMINNNSVPGTDADKKNNKHTLIAQLSYFQVGLKILAPDEDTFCDIRRNIGVSNDDPEVAELEMLYNDFVDYGSGHGCSVDWNEVSGKVNCIWTSFFPTHELLQMRPSVNIESKVFGMKFLSEGNQEEIIEGLNEIVNSYDKWIDKQECTDVGEPYLVAKALNISKCRDTNNVLRKSVEVLRKDDLAFKAFQLANKAMFLQRKNVLTRAKKEFKEEDILWYPFQLAFFLQEIISFSNPSCAERKLVDLLWFPTGGGKTEAYLGIAAFVIFLRRLKNFNKCNGTVVIMRYTLRLLTFQQFERASTLICACELIRKQEKIPGGQISIGLWVGGALTPNTIAAAKKNIEKDILSSEESNPVQITKCPWCGADIDKAQYTVNELNKRMSIHCSNKNCYFHLNELPLYLIDEEIYAYKPTFIVATVDKFAQLPYNKDIGAIFGNYGENLPPELIIQDELHLISGPLGTITGLYETAIDKLCEHEGIAAKVIASTATIRNAKEQILGLYGRKFTQFPPQGINIKDSFFAELSDRNIKPARLYMGCMGIGVSATTMMIRVMSSLLFASRYISEQAYSDSVKDSFWTETAYFNTLRELGGAIIRVVDDIQDRFRYLKDSKFKREYCLKLNGPYNKYHELTSREKSENIGEIIQRKIQLQYPHPDALDFLLSSSMISVGVDVGRLNGMIVVGQPKTTAEYIQATSRVGRETPGIVIATYNQAKSRDRSHYETFKQYHSMFYKYVEATSVTPFADRARDRALQAVYVILARNFVKALINNNNPADYKGVNKEELAKIRKFITDRVEKIDIDEMEHVKMDLDDLDYVWNQKADRKIDKYREFFRKEEALFDPETEEDSRFRGLNTMRSVETGVSVVLREGKDD